MSDFECKLDQIKSGFKNNRRAILVNFICPIIIILFLLLFNRCRRTKSGENYVITIDVTQDPPVLVIAAKDFTWRENSYVDRRYPITEVDPIEMRLILIEEKIDDIYENLEFQYKEKGGY